MSLVEVTVGLNTLDVEVDFWSLVEEAAATKLRFMSLVDMTEGLKGCAAFLLPWWRKNNRCEIIIVGS